MASDRDNRDESRRILDRVERESMRGGWQKASHAARRVGSHLAADDADQDDRIEQIGTRIGRALGLAITVGLFVLLAWLVFGGA